MAGNLPKPGWLAETQKLWPAWKVDAAELPQAKFDAALLWIDAQDDAGLTNIGDGEVGRQRTVHGVLEHVKGIDLQHKAEMSVRADRFYGDRALPSGDQAALRGGVRARATLNAAISVRWPVPGGRAAWKLLCALWHWQTVPLH